MIRTCNSRQHDWHAISAIPHAEDKCPPKVGIRSLLGECSVDKLECCADVMANHFAFEPEHAVAHACQFGVTSRIPRRTSAVIAAINFKYEVRAWGKEIDNSVSDWHLAPKLHPELTATNAQPEALLFGIECRPVLTGA